MNRNQLEILKAFDALNEAAIKREEDQKADREQDVRIRNRMKKHLKKFYEELDKE